MKIIQILGIRGSLILEYRYSREKELLYTKNRSYDKTMNWCKFERFRKNAFERNNWGHWIITENIIDENTPWKVK